MGTRKLLAGLLSLLLVYSLATSFGIAESNQTDTYFVQFKIINLNSQDDASKIDNLMRAKSNIQISRTDVINDVYFCVLSSGISADENQFRTWFRDMGYEISCFNAGLQFVDRLIPPTTLKLCQDEK